MSISNKIIIQKDLNVLKDYFNNQSISLHKLLLDENNEESILELINNNAYNITEIIMFETPLSIAIKTIRLHIIEVIINKLINDGLQDNFNVCDRFGRNSLVLSLIQNLTNIASMLILNGVSIQTKTISIFDPLNIIIKQNNHKLFNMILERLDDTSRYVDYIYLAFKQKNEDMVMAVLKHIKLNEDTAFDLILKFITKKFINGVIHILDNFSLGSDTLGYLLRYAITESTFDIVKTLIKYEANVNHQDIFGFTPLHYAMCNSHYDIALYLMEECNVKRNLVDENNYLWIHCLFENFEGQDDLLLNKFLDIFKRDVNDELIDVNAVTADNYSLLYLAINNGDLPKDLIVYLISKGADVNYKSGRKNTPLYKMLDKFDVYEDILSELKLSNIENTLVAIINNKDEDEDKLCYILNHSNINIRINIDNHDNILLYALFKKSPDNIIYTILGNDIYNTIKPLIAQNIQYLQYAIKRDTISIAISLFEIIKEQGISNVGFKFNQLICEEYDKTKHDLLKELCKLGLNINNQDEDGNTMLHNMCLDDSDPCPSKEDILRIMELEPDIKLKNKKNVSGLDAIILKGYGLDIACKAINIYNKSTVLDLSDSENCIKYLLENNYNLFATHIMSKTKTMDDIMCPICLSIPTNDIYITPCCHIFCKKCADELIDFNGRKVKCPKCRGFFILED